MCTLSVRTLSNISVCSAWCCLGPALQYARYFILRSFDVLLTDKPGECLDILIKVLMKVKIESLTFYIPHVCMKHAA